MPHETIRRVRKGLQERKQSASDRAESARKKLRETKKKAGSTKRRAGRAVAKRTNPVVDEARRTKREASLLAREVAEPVRSAGEAAGEAVSRGKAGVEAAQAKAKRLEESAAAIDERMQEMQDIERETLGMAGQDFDTDLEVVGPGEPMDMGDAGFDVVFDDEPSPGDGHLLDSGRENDLDVVGEETNGGEPIDALEQMDRELGNQ